MFWNVSAIKGYDIAATDGDVGHVADILFDDVSWTVRWLIVHTGSWLNQRAVCLPVWALAQPDPEAHDLAVTLTRRQIENAPEVDEDARLSLEGEAVVSAYYRHLHSDPAALEPSHHLVSLRALKDATVEATDGEIGHVESLLVDARTWDITYLVVHTGQWWADKKVLILPGAVDRIDDIRSSIDLNVSREKVRGSPDYVAAETVDGAFDEQFHIYYGVKWMRK